MAAIDVLRASPSDLLAGICALIHQAGAAEPGRGRLAAAITAMTEDDPVEAPPDEADAGALCEEVLAAIGGDVPARLPDDPAALRALLDAVQRLDRWHEPALFHHSRGRTDAHVAAQDRLFDERHARFNESEEHGFIIPGQAAGLPFQRDASEISAADRVSLGVLRRILQVTSYLPATLMCADPDEDDAGKAAPRPVSVEYRIVRANALALIDPRDPIRIAIAPMAESDADLRVGISGDRYNMAPIYPVARLAAVIAAAVEQGAHIVCMPEMSVAEENLDRLRDTIVEAREAWYDKHRALPALRYVMAGISGRPGEAGGSHRNYLVVLDGRGDIVTTQHKLRHWNLRDSDQKRFAIRQRAGVEDDPGVLREDTTPGTSVTIADLAGIGRLFTLICADIDQDDPGHWLLENVGIDWLFAPIMDGSTCWAQGNEPWIIGKARRAAALSGGRVVVTNSMTMTHWNNATTAIGLRATPPCSYKIVADCGIGLLFDASGALMRQEHVTTRLSVTDTPVLKVVALP